MCLVIVALDSRHIQMFYSGIKLERLDETLTRYHRNSKLKSSSGIHRVTRESDPVQLFAGDHHRWRGATRTVQAVPNEFS